MIIKERPECRKKINEIMKKAGAVTFEEKYYFLRNIWFDNIEELAKDKMKYDADTRKQIEKMFYELHGVYAELEREIREYKTMRKCAECGTKHMVNMEDYRKHVFGEKVKFLCFTCRPKRKF